MEFLKKISGADFRSDVQEAKDIRYEFREAARAIVFDTEGRIAILNVTKHGYHKLPGGGIEDGEDIALALRREILEEVGCEVEVREQTVGMTIEQREEYAMLQISYCYLADVAGAKGEISLTELEADNGFVLQWMSIEEAIDTLEKDAPSDNFAKFMRARDLIFLKKAKSILEHA